MTRVSPAQLLTPARELKKKHLTFERQTAFPVLSRLKSLDTKNAEAQQIKTKLIWPAQVQFLFTRTNVLPPLIVSNAVIADWLKSLVMYHGK